MNSSIRMAASLTTTTSAIITSTVNRNFNRYGSARSKEENFNFLVRVTCKNNITIHVNINITINDNNSKDNDMLRPRWPKRSPDGPKTGLDGTADGNEHLKPETCRASFVGVVYGGIWWSMVVHVIL